jgi:hypothetical protein
MLVVAEIEAIERLQFNPDQPVVFEHGMQHRLKFLFPKLEFVIHHRMRVDVVDILARMVVAVTIQFAVLRFAGQENLPGHKTVPCGHFVFGDRHPEVIIEEKMVFFFETLAEFG